MIAANPNAARLVANRIDPLADRSSLFISCPSPSWQPAVSRQLDNEQRAFLAD